MSKPFRTALCALGSVFLPFLLMTAYLIAIPRDPSSGRDWTALILAITAGLLCIWLLPIDRIQRVGLAVVYVPSAVLLLFLYSLMFVCSGYHDCL